MDLVYSSKGVVPAGLNKEEESQYFILKDKQWGRIVGPNISGRE